MHAGAPRRAHDLPGIDRAESRDVLGHAAREQLDVLRQIAEPGPQLLARPLRQLDMVEPHRARARPARAGEQAQQARLAGTAGADDRERLARLEGERDAGQHQALAARRPPGETLGAQPSDGRGQPHALGLCLGRAEQRAQAAQREPPFGQHAPAAHHLLHRRQCAAEQDRRRHHHARRRLAADDEPGAERLQQHLHRLPRHAGERGHRHRALRRRPLARGDACVQAAPARDQRLGHAERAHHLGVVQRGFEEARRLRGVLLQRLDVAPRQAVVGERQAEHEQRGQRRSHPEQGMGECDHRHVDDHPRRVEEREQALRREQVAQRGDVAQSFTVACPRRAREHDARHGRRQRLGQQVAGHALQPRAQVVEHQHQRQRDRHPEQQHEQGLAALADQHAVEQLQHEQGGRQQQQVDEEGKAGDEEQRPAQQPGELLHRCRSCGRGCHERLTFGC